jgi:hypothetical protein
MTTVSRSGAVISVTALSLSALASFFVDDPTVFARDRRHEVARTGTEVHPLRGCAGDERQQHNQGGQAGGGDSRASSHAGAFTALASRRNPAPDAQKKNEVFTS